MNGLIVAARFIHFAAMALLFGLALFRLTVARDIGGDELRARFDAALWRACRVAALLALVSALGWFAAVAAEMTGSWTELIEPDSIAAVTFDTRFGHIWMARTGVAVLAIALLACPAPRGGARAYRSVVVVAGVLAASLIGVGHAAVGPGMLSLVHLVSDAIHLLCACAWIGGLAGLLLVTGASAGAAGATLAVLLPAFTRMATVAVAVLLASGVINSALLLDGPAALIDTAYGRILLIKVALVAAMLALAAYNRFVLSPAIRKAPGDNVASLSRTVVAELALGTAVLASVALLGTVHPVL